MGVAPGLCPQPPVERWSLEGWVAGQVRTRGLAEEGAAEMGKRGSESWTCLLGGWLVWMGCSVLGVRGDAV